MPTILLVEDDTTISQMLSAYIEREGFQVHIAGDGNMALEVFHAQNPDLIILDINLPGRTGFELLPLFRAKSKAPILMLSARSAEDDKVTSLDLGADDYIPKPFSARELLARINRHLARSQPDAAKSEVMTVGAVRITPSKYLVELSGEEVKLTKTEFELLCHLFKHVGAVVERETLMKEIIGYERYLSDRTIDTHIKNLRKKFEGVLLIETLRAVGYRLHTI